MNLLLKISPITIQIIQILGAFFLIFISWKILFFKPSYNENNEEYKIPKSLFESYLIGFTASLINPKVLIFFSAIFSQFLNENYSVSDKIWYGSISRYNRCFLVYISFIFDNIFNNSKLYKNKTKKYFYNLWFYFNVCVIFV